MPKPTPVDKFLFLIHEAANRGKPFGEETLKAVNAEFAEPKVSDKETFELTSLYSKEAQALVRRREKLLKILTLFDEAKHAGHISDRITLKLLLKWAEVKWNSQKDKEDLLKILLELYTDKMQDSTTLPEILVALDNKYQSLKDIK